MLKSRYGEKGLSRIVKGFCKEGGRGGGIRTHGLYVPKIAGYHWELNRVHYATRFTALELKFESV